MMHICIAGITRCPSKLATIPYSLLTLILTRVVISLGFSVIQNVVGHCISGKKGGGGYLFFGDIPSSTPRISYTPMLSPLKLVNNLIDVAIHSYIYYTQP